MYSCLDTREVPFAQRGSREDVAADAPHVLAGARAAAGAAGRRGRPGAARAAIAAVGHALHEKALEEKILTAGQVLNQVLKYLLEKPVTM